MITIYDATRMTTAARQQENLSTRQRWISLSEFVFGGAIVIARRVGPGDFAPRPSRPGDLHPEPLTDSGRKPLDLSGSCHPKRRLPPPIVIGEFLRLSR